MGGGGTLIPPTDPRYAALRAEGKLRSILSRVPASSDLPATLQEPTLYYVAGTPFTLFLVDENGQNELGWSVQAGCSADTTIDGTERDVTGCSVTLPRPGAYELTGVFDVEAYGGIVGDTAVGKLTDSVNAAETPQALFQPAHVTNGRATVAQVWRIVTTADDEVWKLRVVRSGAAGTSLRAKQNHTTLTAHRCP